MGIWLTGNPDEGHARPVGISPTNLFLLESNSRDRGIKPLKPIMNNQQTTDKAGSPRRLKIMKSDQTLYGILAGSEEKGRGAMETAVYATCILSVVAAIFQFMGQPTPDPFAGFDPAAQSVPVVSHAVEAQWGTKS
jgi:hypothetical protein